MDRKNEKLLERLKHKYRLVVLNDETLEEHLSFRLSQMNVYVLLSTITVVLVILIVMVIAFTPLREYIPGYGDTSTRRTAVEVSYKSDSLESVVLKQDFFIENLKKIIEGNVDSSGIDTAGLSDQTRHDAVDLDSISKKELLLRDEIEKRENYELFDTEIGDYEEGSIADFHFFSPIKGYVTDRFDARIEHYGIDIVGAENEPIKAIADGMVITSSWTVETGNVIAIQHKNNLVSFYKHNSVLLKKVGNFVRAGDVIAIIGSSGEKSTGPHLHFELWHNQTPINPLDYIDFN